MNAKQFRQVIEILVQEEVKKEVSKQLPKLLFEMLGQQPKTVVREQKNSQGLSRPLQKFQTIRNREDDPIEEQITQPRQVKKYVKDPRLNAVLNETTPGLPSTPYGNQGVQLPNFDKIGGVSEEFKSEMQETLHEDTSIHQSVPEVVEGVPTSSGQVDLSKMFNKPFKAILEASKRGHNGGMSGVLQSW